MTAVDASHFLSALPVVRWDAIHRVEDGVECAHKLRLIHWLRAAEMDEFWRPRALNRGQSRLSNHHA